MKQIRIMASAFTLLMIASLAGGLLLLRGTGYRGRDVSVYNDRIHRMYADYAAGVPEKELEAKYGCDIILSADLVDAELIPDRAQ